jgi:hypothetical protein
MDSTLIPLQSRDGRQLLKESKAQEAFWELSQYYAPQPDLGSCSVASCTMILNALPIDRPVSPHHAPFKLFTPDNFFTKEVEAIVPRKQVSSSGMSLGQLASVLATYPLAVETVYASDSDLDRFRKVLADSLARPDTFVLVNYLRKSLGQESGGHISPLGAYNQQADRVLILDTANYKYPWTWVKTEHLWKAMVESDPESKRSRGYVLVSAKRK